MYLYGEISFFPLFTLCSSRGSFVIVEKKNWFFVSFFQNFSKMTKNMLIKNLSEIIALMDTKKAYRKIIF